MSQPSSVCHSDDERREEEESAIADAARKQIPRAKSRRFGMTIHLRHENTSPHASYPAILKSEMRLT